MRRRRTAILLLLFVLLTACAHKEEKGEGSFLLYCPAAQLESVPGEDAIVTREFMVDGAREMGTEELALALLDGLLQVQEDASLRAPLPAGTRVQEITLSGKLLRVDFSKQYARLSGVDLTLADYCVALTLTQLDAVNGASITVEGRALPQRRERILTSADPLLSSTEETLRPVTVQLYFAEESGVLCARQHSLHLYEGQSQTSALLAALLAGPTEEGLESCVPADLEILSVRSKEGLCYLDLAAETKLSSRAIEALVASLCSLPNVQRVQLAFGGEVVPMMGTVDVSRPLEPTIR